MANRTPHFDAKIQALLDTVQPGPRTCRLTGEAWELTSAHVQMYRKFQVPPLDISPNAVWKWLAYFDSGYQFWWNRHAETGEPVLTFHHPASGVRVLPDAEWHARDFSSLTYPYDPSRPFFDQMREFEKQVPFLATYNLKEPEASTAFVSLGDKRSQFVIASSTTDCFFSNGSFGSEQSFLLFLTDNASQCHETVHCSRLFRCRYARESHGCIDSAFLFDCRNCKNCFGATNKRNREYMFLNEQLTKEEYERRVAAIDLGSRAVVAQWKEAFERLLREQAVWPESFSLKAENSTGEYLNGATDCTDCFYAADATAENAYCAWSFGVSQGNAFCWGPANARDTYLCVTTPKSSGSKFCYRCMGADGCEYCIQCADCRFCFGCIGLKRKEYCMFNVQYSEEEYWRKVDELKCSMLERGEYGHFFPTAFATCYVPENGAALWCGATPGDLARLGGNAFDPNAEGATVKTAFDPSAMRSVSDIPDSIGDLGDDWAGVPIYDAEAKRSFSFLKHEIELYRALRIAPPNRHFIPRFIEAATAGQAVAFEKRACANCSKPLTVSACPRYPDRRIYCRECYLSHIEQNG
ncbi:hypothetical protein HY734_01110 [Candidatus Uhrbacteria bacterium]|nr:hypothetical protein [Candidatus Uhrbacteria bacterium]